MDPFVEGALSEGNIPVMVLPYVSTAREGAERLMDLVYTYGMGSAESIFIRMKKDETPVMWCSLCAPEFSLYVPLRSDVIEIPAVLANEATTYDPDSIYWQQRNIMNIAATDRESYSDLVRVPFEVFYTFALFLWYNFQDELMPDKDLRKETGL